MWKQLHSAAFILKDYLGPEALQNFLLDHHFAKSSQSVFSQYSTSSVAKDTDYEASTAPASVETFRVAASAKSFLTKILLNPLVSPPVDTSMSSSHGLGGFSPGSAIPIVNPSAHLAPEPNISLIEKQLLMFCSVIGRGSGCNGHEDSSYLTTSFPPRMAWNDVSFKVMRSYVLLI